MRVSKLRLSKEASSRLRFLAGKTGLTPNLLCRMGFCVSLSELSSPNPADYLEEEREFNRYTLLGEYDALFVALLKERCQQDGTGVALEEAFRAHMNRGIILLQKRLKDIDHLGVLFGSAAPARE